MQAVAGHVPRSSSTRKPGPRTRNAFYKPLTKTNGARLNRRVVPTSAALFIRDLNNALIRIENKTYGLCRVTGKLIEAERLKLVPHATMSMEAKLKQR